MRNIRIVARLDIKGHNLIKGVHLEGLRVLGSPNEFALNYYTQGIDELIYMDCVASLYGRNNLGELVKEVARNVFVPLTVGGGIRSVEDVKSLLRCGADKVALNTGAIARPELIREIANQFGSQCMVLSVEAKQIDVGKWEAYTDNGRERTGLDVVEWVQKAVSLGAGEVLLTSVDKEGTRKGFDLELIKSISSVISIPVIVSGGFGKPSDFIEAVNYGGADAIAIADGLHYNRFRLEDIRNFAIESGINVRKF